MNRWNWKFQSISVVYCAWNVWQVGSILLLQSSTCVCVCVHAFVCVCACVGVWVCVCFWVCLGWCVCGMVCVWVCVCVCVCVTSEHKAVRSWPPNLHPPQQKYTTTQVTPSLHVDKASLHIDIIPLFQNLSLEIGLQPTHKLVHSSQQNKPTQKFLQKATKKSTHSSLPHTHTYTHACTHIHTHTHRGDHLIQRLYLFACLSVWSSTNYTHTHTPTNTHAHTLEHTQTHTHTLEINPPPANL